MKHNYLMKTVLVLLSSLLCMGAMAETYKLTISPSDFNTTSYAANNGDHTLTAVSTTDNTKTMSVVVVSNQVMLITEVMQWQKNTGYIYNKTNLGTISAVKVNSTAGTFTTYYGTAEKPETDKTVGNGYFNIKVGGATGKTSSVEIEFDPSTGTADNKKTEASITATYKTDLSLDEDDEYTVSYNGDATLSISSSDENVVEAIIDGNQVLISAVSAGSANITISAPSTEKYTEAQLKYTVTVTDPANLSVTIAQNDADVAGKGTSGTGSDFSVTRGDVTANFIKAYGASGHIKLYTGSSLSVAANEGYAITQVVMTATSKDYAKTWVDQNGKKATTSDKTVTWKGISPVVTLENEASAQARIVSVEISYVSLEELDEVTVSAAGYATYVAPMNVIIGDGTVSSYITGAEGKELTLVAAPVVAEGEAVLLSGAGTYKIYGHDDLAATKKADNKLVAGATAPVGSYVLQSQNGKVGFYQVQGVSKATNGHAYLNMGDLDKDPDVIEDVKAFILADDATAIKNVKVAADNVTFNLQGQRVNADQKGLYIVNGKKVVK